MKLRKSLSLLSLVLVVAVMLAAFVPAPAAAKSKRPKMGNTPKCETSIVDIALSVNAETGEFSTLIAALAATNLVKPLDCRSNGRSKVVTVFAPTDEAFAKLGLNADNIGKAFSKKDLSKILLYHVTPGALYASDVVSMSSIRMSKGGTVGVEVNDQGAFLLSNNAPAQIISVDIKADNGVIHVINEVLLP